MEGGMHPRRLSEVIGALPWSARCRPRARTLAQGFGESKMLRPQTGARVGDYCAAPPRSAGAEAEPRCSCRGHD
eukprot:183655-Amphidinium_carterae.1